MNNGGQTAFVSSLPQITNSVLGVEENGDLVTKFYKTNLDIEMGSYALNDIFINPASNNYKLKNNSPVINKGNNAQHDTSILKDLDGNERIQGWKIDLGVYEANGFGVKYNSNGATLGEEPIDYKLYTGNDSVTINGKGNLEKNNYTFSGWNTEINGLGITYNEKDLLSLNNKDVELYAIWKQINATPPVINTQPQNATVLEGQPVTIQVDATGNAALSYQWYSNTVNDSTGGVLISGAQSATFTTPTTEAGTTYYYVVVTNTDTAVTGNQTASVMSNVIRVQVNRIPSSSGGKTRLTQKTAEVTLHTSEGAVMTPIIVNINTKVDNLPVPTRAGFRFEGWYEDATLTKRWVDGTLVRENISLYAKWTALPVVDPEFETVQEPASPQPTMMFDDIASHWAKEMIEELATRGIIQGFEDGSFRPNGSISRMHVAALLTRAFPFENVREVRTFSDVPTTHPYYEAIQTLQQAGIIDGMNGAFLPKENMTRAQLAKILVGILGLTPEGTASFSDVASTHWSTSYIAVLEREGIAMGDNGNYRPNDPVTRAQFVAFLYRIMNR